MPSVGDRRKYPLAFVGDLVFPVLSDGDEKHFRASLRLTNDDIVTVSDGQGRYRFARLGSLSGSESEIRVQPPPPVSVSVGFSPVKAQKAEWMVQKLTELGVDIIQPLIAERSVVRWDRKKRVALETRLAVAAREAAMQCRRVRLPTIEQPRTVAEVVASSAEPGQVVALADPAGEEISDPATMVLIGPEGGWSDAEMVLAPGVRLPGNVLRAETAVIAAGTMLGALRSGFSSS